MNKNLDCNWCYKTFSSTSTLNRHKTVIHGEVTIPKSKLKCPGCVSEYKTILELNNHVLKSHADEIQLAPIQNLTFNDVSSFEIWKKDMERKDMSKFSKTRGSRILSNNISRHYYYCHRTGQFNSKSKGNRTLKHQGSCKIGYACPAHVVANFLTSGKVNVIYFPVHYGHDKNIQYLNLTKDERQGIANLLSQNVPFSDILESAQKILNTSANLRIFHITKYDLQNIAKEFKITNIKEYRKCSHKERANKKKEDKKSLEEVNSLKEELTSETVNETMQTEFLNLNNNFNNNIEYNLNNNLDYNLNHSEYNVINNNNELNLNNHNNGNIPINNYMDYNFNNNISNKIEYNLNENNKKNMECSLNENSKNNNENIEYHLNTNNLNNHNNNNIEYNLNNIEFNMSNNNNIEFKPQIDILLESDLLLQETIKLEIQDSILQMSDRLKNLLDSVQDLNRLRLLKELTSQYTLSFLAILKPFEDELASNFLTTNNNQTLELIPMVCSHFDFIQNSNFVITKANLFENFNNNNNKLTTNNFPNNNLLSLNIDRTCHTNTINNLNVVIYNGTHNAMSTKTKMKPQSINETINISTSSYNINKSQILKKDYLNHNSSSDNYVHSSNDAINRYNLDKFNRYQLNLPDSNQNSNINHLNSNSYNLSSKQINLKVSSSNTSYIISEPVFSNTISKSLSQSNLNQMNKNNSFPFQMHFISNNIATTADQIGSNENLLKSTVVEYIKSEMDCVSVTSKINENNTNSIPTYTSSSFKSLINNQFYNLTKSQFTYTAGINKINKSFVKDNQNNSTYSLLNKKRNTKFQNIKPKIKNSLNKNKNKEINKKITLLPTRFVQANKLKKVLDPSKASLNMLNKVVHFSDNFDLIKCKKLNGLSKTLSRSRNNKLPNTLLEYMNLKMSIIKMNLEADNIDTMSSEKKLNFNSSFEHLNTLESNSNLVGISESLIPNDHKHNVLKFKTAEKSQILSCTTNNLQFNKRSVFLPKIMTTNNLTMPKVILSKYNIDTPLKIQNEQSLS